MTGLSLRARRGLPLAGACALAATLALGTGSALADSLPNPVGPGPLAFPGFSASSFQTPPAATRPKYRWWQPVAFTNDAEIQRELGNVAADFGGGLEQNGFAVSMNAGGASSQFSTFAASQAFGQIYGWGSPLWSHRTEVYQVAAAQDGVIGDMNEGSRWNNTVPTVFSPNQIADAQDLDGGFRQYLAGQNPSGQLPNIGSPAQTGVATKLTVNSNIGDQTVQVQTIAGLLAGDQVTLGAGSQSEHATIASVGTSSPVVALTQQANAGASVVHVPAGGTATGLTGTANPAAQFVAGMSVTIGSGATAESDVIASIGTYDIASPTTVAAAPGAPGAAIPASATNVELASVSNVLKGDTITFGTGATAQSATITSVGGAGSGTTLSGAASSGSLSITVASATGLSAGQWIEVGLDGSQELDRIATISGTTLNLYTPLSLNHASGDAVFLQSLGVTFTPALTAAVPVGTAALDTGSGISLQTPLQNTHPVGDNFLAPGTGVTFAAPLTKAHVAGTNTRISTTLSANTSVGATNIKVASINGIAPGDVITVGANGFTENATVAAGGVGTTGATGTGITLTSGLTLAHFSGDAVVDATPRTASTTLAAAAPSGGTAPFTIDVASAAGMAVNDSITIGTGATLETKTVTAIGGAGAGAAGGTLLTINSALANNHAVGEAVADTTNPGAAGSAGLSDLEKETLVKAELIQCLAPSQADQAVSATTTVFTPTSGSIASTGSVLSVNSVSGISAGDVVTLGTGAGAQTTNVTAVGTQGRNTALTAASAAGATSITVASNTGIASGDKISVDTAGNTDTATVASISGTTGITLQAPGLAHPHSSGAAVSDNGTGLTLGNSLSGVTSGSPVFDTCTSATTGGTRNLDPTSSIDVTSQIANNPQSLNWAVGTLNFTAGNLPNGSDTYTPPGGTVTGMPYELFDFYMQGDTQTNSGGTATTPNQWLGHLSVASAKAMTDYFDDNILNDPATQAAINYQDAHNGTPAAFEDSLENSNNLNWTPDMLSEWQSVLGYDVSPLLPVLLGTGNNATGTSLFDFPQSDTGSRGATLGWRVRDDYGTIYTYLYNHDYVATMNSWAAGHGLTFRAQSYGDPIDDGDAASNVGIPEGEHLEFNGDDETQQFKVIASGTYQSGQPHYVSDECCEANSQAWADPFGYDGTGSAASPGATQANGISDYLDMAGGVDAIVYHGWPYTVGSPGSPAIWPGNTYGGDTSFAAGNGPNQPQFADDRNNNINVARRDVILRDGQPAFDVAVFHEDNGLSGQGQDSVAGGWAMGTVTSGGVSQPAPSSGKLLRSSSSLSQAGYLYGYVSPEFFRYPSATFAVDPNNIDQSNQPQDNKVLFPGHGDYRSLVLYDQTVLPLAAAQKIATLAGEGLPIVIVGPVPNAAPTPTGDTVAAMTAQDQAVQAAMAQVTASSRTVVVADATAGGSQSSDGNAPAALTSLGILPSTQLNTPSLGTGTATPILSIRRHDATTDTDYYQLFNMDQSATAFPSVTLVGNGTPYLLNTWAATVSPIANYSSLGNRVTLSVRISPGNAIDIAISPNDPGQNGNVPSVHATGTTANATPEGSDNVVFNSNNQMVARASTSGSYTTTLSDGSSVSSNITVPAAPTGSAVSTVNGVPTLTSWQLWVDSWTQTPSGDPTQTLHTEIPACPGATQQPGITSTTLLSGPILGQPTIGSGASEIPSSPPQGNCNSTFTVTPLQGTSDGSLPAWAQITPQASVTPAFAPADNLTNAAGIGVYSTTFNLPPTWSTAAGGFYLNVGSAVDTVDVWVNNQPVPVDENDRNQIDIGPWLVAGNNTLTISVATPLRNAVAVAPATPATGQVPNSAETIGALQGGAKLANTGLIGPVTLTPYGQSAPLATSSSTGTGSVSVPVTVSGSVGGNVPGSLALSLGSTNISLGSFNPGAGTTTYSTTVAATATSTAGGAELSASDPSSQSTGFLVNGTFALANPLKVQAVDGGVPAVGVSHGYQGLGSTASPADLLDYAGPTRNDPLTIGFAQTIGASEPLRSGTYAKTVVFTLSVTTP